MHSSCTRVYLVVTQSSGFQRHHINMPTPLDRAANQRVSDSWIPWDYIVIVGVVCSLAQSYTDFIRVPSSSLLLSSLASQHGAFGVRISSPAVIPLAVCNSCCARVIEKSLTNLLLDPDTWTRDQCVAWLNNVSAPYTLDLLS